ncbi:hypothetical protein G3I33_16650 [Streptomyces sp. SID9124]|nr:hypothetical protein [Streptomyces sp. SID9124]
MPPRGASAGRGLGPVVKLPSAARRLARTLAAPAEIPSTSSTRDRGRHAESTHQTPHGRPPGDEGSLTTGPRAGRSTRPCA